MTSSFVVPTPPGVVLIGDDQVQAIPVAESGEALVDVATVPELDVDHRLADAYGHYRLLRSGVVERLVEAAARLPAGWRLRVVEGYRPLALQRRYFERYLRRLAAAYPDWEAAEVERTATRYVAPPTGVPPHSTGGAVDLALGTDDGTQLDLGTDVNATPEESDGRCYTGADLTAEASARRRALVDALSAAGLVNYPTEWWHWSYGEQYWAFTTGARQTRYAPLRQPD